MIYNKNKHNIYMKQSDAVNKGILKHIINVQY